MDSFLQSLNHAPRNTKDPRGPDGKLYFMGNESHNEKYKTLTDEEMEEEERMNREMASSLKLMRGKIDAQGNPRRQKSSSFVPPHLGISNRSRKIEKRAWDKKLNESQEREEGGVVDEDHSSIPVNGTNTDGLSSEDRLMHAVATMQEKYTENMSVIEQLFSEKKQMEKRMAALEEELERTKREQIRSEAMRRKIQAKDRLNQTAPGLAQGRGIDYEDDEKEVRKHSRHNAGLSRTTPVALNRDRDNVAVDDLIEDDLMGDEYVADDDELPAPAYVDSPPRSRHGSTDNLAASTVRVSAADMASIFAEDAMRRPAAVDRSRGLRESGSKSARGRSSDGKRGAGVRDSTGSVARRSHSLTRGLGSTGGTSTGPSASLQADTDRYLQKVKLAKEKERKEREEQEQHELQLKEKFMRASHRGSEFISMTLRAKEAEEKRKARLNEKYAKAQQEEVNRQERERLEKMRIERIKNSTGADRSWQDIQREEETRRKDRIEQRKMELAGKAAYPSTMADSVEKWKTKKTTSLDEQGEEPMVKTFVAQNPSDVAAQLKRKQEQWDKKLELEKEKKRALHSAVAPTKATLEMEERHRALAEKAQERMNRTKQKEEEAKQAEELKRRQSMEKLMNAKVPEASRRLTKAVEFRAKAVQSAKQKAEEEEQREQAKQQQKEKQLKETSNFLKSLVKRKTETPQEKEAALQERVKSSAEQFKANRLKNKQAILAVQSNRPTLIERQDQAVAKANAGTAALGKVANAFMRGMTVSGGAESKSDAWKELARREDILDETEKIKVGLRDNLIDDLDEFA